MRFYFKNRFSKQAIVESITGFLVFLFLYTGISKYLEHGSFVKVLQKSILLGWAAGFIAATLPGFEIALVVLLVIPRTRLVGLWISFYLLLLFAIYLSYMVIFSPKLPCGCGGILTQLSWKGHIFFNLSCALLNWIAIRNQRRLLREPAHGTLTLSV